MKTNTQKSFTLIEILVIIVILSILTILTYRWIANFKDLGSLTKEKSDSVVLKNSLAENILADWAFNEGSGVAVTDLSRYHYSATLGAEFTDTTAGHGDTSDSGWMSASKCIFGTCLKFDGVDDYVIFPYDITGGFSAVTVEIWIKADGEQEVNIIMSKPYDFFVHFAKTNFFYLTGEDTTVSDYLALDDYLPYNKWVHIVATWDGSTMSAFINGEKQTSTLAFNGGATGRLISPTEFTVGNDFYGVNPHFKGLIDDIRIYGAAVPTSKIREDYFSGLNKLLSDGSITNQEYEQRFAELNKSYAEK
ncbi:MAG: LamG domain-containing protein [Candidatus Paceibacterota bacterium]|jgi:type II secretory pathway pseudopilin PulG